MLNLINSKLKVNASCLKNNPNTNIPTALALFTLVIMPLFKCFSVEADTKD